eukprot:TRINITY_DN1204_c0_g1_i1.p1 TRINITY_DN1204_c0_g1~~TRINITY_DN1204_c0_g1_i1.p1  ORF type:complete len:481 (-),score=83.98 TRINITY_DN1204_c0_g1_i1:350-1792(-)
MQPRLRRGLGVLVILTLLWRSQRRKWGFAAILSGAFFWICQWYYKRIKSNPENYFRLPSSVNVQIVNSEDQIDTMLKPLLKDIKESQFPVIGFDTEWKPRSGSYVSPLALVQLSSEKECILIRVCNMKCFTPALKVLMEDSSILKVGVGISLDARLVWQQYGVLTKGCVDLQPLAHRYNRVQAGCGLSNLSLSVLNLVLNKDHKIRCGNWEAYGLSPVQIEYAAIDAWIALKIFRTLYLENNTMGATSPKEWCLDVIDGVFTQAFTTKKKSKKKDLEAEGLTASDLELMNEKMESYRRIPVRKSVLYENILMQAPDGEVICSINNKKARWYLERDLAIFIEEKPHPILRLKNAPKGRGHSGDEYYLSEKQNNCVVCGLEENFSRFSIVPHSYRKLFPLNLKSHSSHDIVLLCQKCHSKASSANEALKNTLTKEMRVQQVGTPQWEINNQLREITRFALALKNNRGSKTSRRGCNEVHKCC